MTKLIKVYGERNTNTNYVSRLIEQNLAVSELRGTSPRLIRFLQYVLPGREWLNDLYAGCSFPSNLGWKHSCVRPWDELAKYAVVRDGVVFVTITKNPYSWLLSLYRRPYHRRGSARPADFESFLRTPWMTVRRDNTASVLESPIGLWNIKNRSYLQLDQSRSLNLTTEAILDNPEAVIDRMSRELHLGRRTERFMNYEESTKDADKDYSFYRDYYLNEKWREKLSTQAIELINQTVDQQLMAHFGYAVLA